jgi:hypothetical protein
MLEDAGKTEKCEKLKKEGGDMGNSSNIGPVRIQKEACSRQYSRT